MIHIFGKKDVKRHRTIQDTVFCGSYNSGIIQDPGDKNLKQRFPYPKLWLSKIGTTSSSYADYSGSVHCSVCDWWGLLYIGSLPDDVVLFDAVRGSPGLPIKPFSLSWVKLLGRKIDGWKTDRSCKIHDAKMETRKLGGSCSSLKTGFWTVIWTYPNLSPCIALLLLIYCSLHRLTSLWLWISRQDDRHPPISFPVTGMTWWPGNKADELPNARMPSGLFTHLISRLRDCTGTDWHDFTTWDIHRHRTFHPIQKPIHHISQRDLRTCCRCSSEFQCCFCFDDPSDLLGSSLRHFVLGSFGGDWFYFNTIPRPRWLILFYTWLWNISSG